MVLDTEILQILHAVLNSDPLHILPQKVPGTLSIVYSISLHMPGVFAGFPLAHRSHSLARLHSPLAHHRVPETQLSLEPVSFPMPAVPHPYQKYRSLRRMQRIHGLIPAAAYEPLVCGVTTVQTICT